MMLFKLSLKNVQKSFKDYAIYFFTLILGVAIFYVFNSIESQTVLLNISDYTHDIVDLMMNILSGVSVFVAFILGFLIIYASRFLIKRRNKEFGVYLTLGMSKRKISLILFLETISIGLLSLGIGLAVGVGLSQIMSVLVAKMFDADMTHFTFIFSSNAFLKTLFYFGIMYILVMLFNTFQINRCKLIDLLYFNRKSEKISLKNPILCVIVFLISATVLGYAYYLVTGGVSELNSSTNILLPITLGSVSTFFIFWSLSGLLLKIFMSMKKTYYKGLNSFTLRQVSSKINTTVFSMTTICLMLFVTICVFSSALSIRNSASANLKELSPADIMLSKRQNIPADGIGGEYNQAQIEDSRLSIEETFHKLGIDLDSYFKEKIDFRIYRDHAVTLGIMLGNTLEEVKKQYPFLRYDTTEDIVKLSDYNQIARIYGNKQYSLKENEYLIIADLDASVKVRNQSLAKKKSLTIFGRTLVPKYKECQNGFIEMGANHITSGIIIVPDSVVVGKEETYLGIIANYKVDTKEEKIAIEKELMALEKHPDVSSVSPVSMASKLLIIESTMGLGVLVTFVGLYLGIIFLISSAAILALKELSESTDNKERFQMLRKLGTDEKVIRRALFRQIGIFFLFPLLLAVIHSVVGIHFCSYILETFGKDELVPSIIMTSVFLIFIYGGYFLLTYFCSKNIIREK